MAINVFIKVKLLLLISSQFLLHKIHKTHNMQKLWQISATWAQC